MLNIKKHWWPWLVAVWSLFLGGFSQSLMAQSVAEEEKDALEASQVIRVGVSEFAERSINESLIPVTLRELARAVQPRYRLEITVFSVATLQDAVKDGKLDIVISSAGTYRRLALAGTNIRDLATISSARAPNPNYADGSLFFTRKSRDDLNTLEDMRGKTVAAMHEYAFSGWQIAAEEIFKNGYNPEHFFGQVQFYGHRAPAILEAVEAGHVDVGIVRACFLEDMGVDPQQFKIVNPRRPDGLIHCARSTDLYPNWTVSTLPSTNPEVSRRIAAILLTMPPIEHELHWSVATDFRPVDQLFWDLKIGPYEYLRHFSFTRFIKTYWAYLLPILIIIVGLAWHGATVSGLVRKRTAQLQNALVREKAQQAEAELAQARFARLQRIGIVGQMSSMIAHELRQPLATISMYCYGLLRRFENGTASSEVTVASLEKMAAQTQRASAIVDQVRLYARGNRERSPQDVVALTKAVLSDMTKTQRDVTLRWETAFPDEPLWVEASALEIELMVQNVLKNAVAAALETPNKQAVIQLTVREEPGHAIIAVANSGRILDEATWDNITQSSMPTTKDAGLGLGLSIVRSVTEDLGGRLQFHRPEMGGLICEIRLVTTKERP